MIIKKIYKNYQKLYIEVKVEVFMPDQEGLAENLLSVLALQ